MAAFLRLRKRARLLYIPCRDNNRVRYRFGAKFIYIIHRASNQVTRDATSSMEHNGPACLLAFMVVGGFAMGLTGFIFSLRDTVASSSSSSVEDDTAVYVFVNDSNFTVPSAASLIYVSAVGAGGGGGGGGKGGDGGGHDWPYDFPGGGGGGSGGVGGSGGCGGQFVSRKSFEVSRLSSRNLVIIIGSGGAGGAAGLPGSAPESGHPTSVSTDDGQRLLSAASGSGGNGGTHGIDGDWTIVSGTYEHNFGAAGGDGVSANRSLCDIGNPGMVGGSTDGGWSGMHRVSVTYEMPPLPGSGVAAYTIVDTADRNGESTFTQEVPASIAGSSTVRTGSNVDGGIGTAGSAGGAGGQTSHPWFQYVVSLGSSTMNGIALPSTAGKGGDGGKGGYGGWGTEGWTDNQTYGFEGAAGLDGERGAVIIEIVY